MTTDVAMALDQLVPAAQYSGSLTGNTQADYDALVWSDQRAKPTWALIMNTGATMHLVHLRRYAADKRWRVETGGIVVGGVPVPTDDRAKVLLMGAASMMADVDTAPYVSGTTAVTLTGAQFKGLYAALTAHAQAAFAVQTEVLAAIDAGTITTTAEIDAAAWPPNG